MRFFPGLAPLRYRDFALYWVGLTISQSGTWMETTVTTWLLYELTGSPVLLGLGGLFRAIPSVALGLIGGTLADRVSRRWLLLVTQVGAAVTALILGILVLTGLIEFWHLYAASALNGALGAFDGPARRSLYPTLVPPDQLQNATTLNAGTLRIARLLGPAVAGVLIVGFGPAGPYFVNAASFVAIIWALLVIRTRDTIGPRLSSFGADVMAGLRHSLGTPLLRMVLFLESGHSLFSINAALITIFAKEVLQVGPQGLGIMFSSVGAGALAGVATLVMVGEIDRKGRFLLLAGLAHAVAFGLFAWSRSFELSLFLLMTLGFADVFWGTMLNTIFQLRAGNQYRGRTMSLGILVGRGFTHAGQLPTGVVVAGLGPATAATLAALLLGATVLGANALSQDVRRFRSADLATTLRASDDAAGS